jgi:hypothetical protein
VMPSDYTGCIAPMERVVPLLRTVIKTKIAASWFPRYMSFRRTQAQTPWYDWVLGKSLGMTGIWGNILKPLGMTEIC